MNLITKSVFALCLTIATLHIGQTESEQWSKRPSVICENGGTVHHFATINAERVNIRDLPTVFSNVLTQKNSPDSVVVVCEFGVWSQIDLPDFGSETWVSSGLITLDPKQPLTLKERIGYICLLAFGLVGLLLSIYKPSWLQWVSDSILQTQRLPPHAQPLISNVNIQRASEGEDRSTAPKELS